MCEGSNFSTFLPILVILKCIYFYYSHPRGRLLYGGDFESVEMKTRFLSRSSRELLDTSNDAHSLGTKFWKNSSFVLLHPVPGMQTVIFQGYWLAEKWVIGPEQIKKLKLYIYIYIHTHTHTHIYIYTSFFFYCKIVWFLKHLLKAPTENTHGSKSTVVPS